MPKFTCSYAYDIPHYLDFTVEAKDERAALRQCRAALKADAFDAVTAQAQPCYENQTAERVFVQGPATESAPETTLAEILALQTSAPTL